jgi:hypothetical protein
MTEPTTDPTPEAELLRELWYDLVEKDDRTSPEEYPDMAMLTQDEFFAYLRMFAQAAVERERARCKAVARYCLAHSALQDAIFDDIEHRISSGEQP